MQCFAQTQHSANYSAEAVIAQANERANQNDEECVELYRDALYAMQLEGAPLKERTALLLSISAQNKGIYIDDWDRYLDVSEFQTEKDILELAKLKNHNGPTNSPIDTGTVQSRLQLAHKLDQLICRPEFFETRDSLIEWIADSLPYRRSASRECYMLLLKPGRNITYEVLNKLSECFTESHCFTDIDAYETGDSSDLSKFLDRILSSPQDCLDLSETIGLLGVVQRRCEPTSVIKLANAIVATGDKNNPCDSGILSDACWQAGCAHIRLKDFAMAEQDFRNSLAYDAKGGLYSQISADLKTISLVQCLINEHKLDDAKQLCAAKLSRFINTTQLNSVRHRAMQKYLLGAIEFYSNDNTGAKPLLEEADCLFQQAPEPEYELADKSVIEGFPNHLETLSLLGRTYVQSGDLIRQQEIQARISKMNADSLGSESVIDALSNQIGADSNDANFSLILEKICKMIPALSPAKRNDTLFRVTRSCIEVGALRLGRMFVDCVLETGNLPESERIKLMCTELRMMSILQDQKSLARALTALRTSSASEDNQEWASIKAALAQQALLNDDAPGAEALAKEAIQFRAKFEDHWTAENAETNVCLARALFRQGKYIPAEAALCAAIQDGDSQAPVIEEAYSLMSLCFMKTGHTSLAKTTMSKVFRDIRYTCSLANHPSYAQTYCNGGELEMADGKRLRALRYFDHAYKIVSDFQMQNTQLGVRIKGAIAANQH